MCIVLGELTNISGKIRSLALQGVSLPAHHAALLHGVVQWSPGMRGSLHTGRFSRPSGPPIPRDPSVTRSCAAPPRHRTSGHLVPHQVLAVHAERTADDVQARSRAHIVHHPRYRAQIHSRRASRAKLQRAAFAPRHVQPDPQQRSDQRHRHQRPCSVSGTLLVVAIPRTRGAKLTVNTSQPMRKLRHPEN